MICEMQQSFKIKIKIKQLAIICIWGSFSKLSMFIYVYRDLSHRDIYINAKFSDKFIELVNINTI